MRYLLIIFLFLSGAVHGQDFFMLTASINPNALDKTLRTVPGTDDGGYYAFGNWANVSSTKKVLSFRRGTSHTEGGRVELIDYNTETKTFSNKRIAFAYTAPWDARDPRVAFLNGRIYIFFIRANRSEGLDATSSIRGYIRSTDATGNAWEPFVDLGVPRYGTPWGEMVAGDTPGTYYLPFWESDLLNGGRWDVGYYKTTDNGANWTQVYAAQQTALHITETWMQNCGGGKLILISRIEVAWGNTGGLVQMTSTNGGTTWSTPVRTNLGGTNVNVPTLHYNANDNTLTCVYQSRVDGWLYVSAHNNVSAIFTSPTAWRVPAQYAVNNVPASGNVNGLGYADWDGRVISWAYETSVNTASLKYREEDFSQYLP